MSAAFPTTPIETGFLAVAFSFASFIASSRLGAIKFLYYFLVFTRTFLFLFNYLIMYSFSSGNKFSLKVPLSILFLILLTSSVISVIFTIHSFTYFSTASPLIPSCIYLLPIGFPWISLSGSH